MWNTHRSYWGSVSLDTNSIGSCFCYNSAVGSFQTMKLLADFWWFFVEIYLCEKQQIWVSEPHFRKVRGDAWPWLMARWKAPGRLSIHIIWTFSQSITVPQLWGEMCTARLFSQGGSTSLHSNFTWTGLSPSTILGVRKLETLGYPMVKTASLCVPLFWHNTRVWQTDGGTDRRICRSIYSRLQI